MTKTVTAIYEHGVLRPLTPLDLSEHAIVQISVAPLPPTDDPGEQRRRFRAIMIAAGLMIDEPKPTPTTPPLSEEERAILADKLAVPGAKPLSEIIIEEREER